LPPRSYFYQDTEGNLKKFAYCCMCGAGPFKESEKNYKYLAIGDKNANNYCITCVNQLRLSKESLIDNKEVVEKEVIKEVFYSNMSTAKAPVLGFDSVTPEEDNLPKRIRIPKEAMAGSPKKTKSKMTLTREKVKEICQQIPPLFKEIEKIDLSIFELEVSKEESKPLLSEETIDEELLALFPVEGEINEDEESLPLTLVEEVKEEILPQASPVEEVKEEIVPPLLQIDKPKEVESLSLPLEVEALPKLMQELPTPSSPTSSYHLLQSPLGGIRGFIPPFLITWGEEKFIEETGTFYTYIGQFADDSIFINWTKDLNEDIELINSGGLVLNRSLPMEIIFCCTSDNKKDAINSCESILRMDDMQKELLIKTFNQNFFNK
jgi:predicted GIY-YIG superfamily endonuclease